MNASVDPARVLRRSQLYRRHVQCNATFVERFDAVHVAHYGNPDDEASVASRLGVCDLSLLPRHGVIGAGSASWLRANRYVVPQQPNTSQAQVNGDLLARLSAQEFLCLRLSELGSVAEHQQSEWSVDPESQAYAVPRGDSHCLFAVTGERAATMFSKLCGIDLRPHKFSDGLVAQTSVARVNAIVIRHDLNRAHNFYLLSATSAAEYLWDCLLDAIDEYDGKPTGIAALQALAKSQP